MSARNDFVGSQTLQASAVSVPVIRSICRDTPIVVEVYALGVSVFVKGQGGDLPAGQSAFELEANGEILIFDPILAQKSNGLVVSIQGDIAPVLQKIEAVDQENCAELGHGVTPCVKTAILSLPQGYGKTAIAEKLTGQLGCSHIVDEWAPGDLIHPGTLHLTNVNLAPGARP